MPECWFKGLPDAGPCEGRLVKCHLVKQQVLKREGGSSSAISSRVRSFGTAEVSPSRGYGLAGAVAVAGVPVAAAPRDDPRTWVWGCGLSRAGRSSRPVQAGRAEGIPLSLLPEGFTRLMAELGLWWYVERTFNRRSSFEDTFTSTEDGAGAAAVAAEAYIGRRRL
jgi:hypothetical protein